MVLSVMCILTHNTVGRDPAAMIFSVVWFAVMLYILYSFLRPCFTRRPQAGQNTRRPGTGPSRPNNPSGWFSGYRPDDAPNEPPPPYSKYSNASASTAADPGWRPGFWTGAALGGLGTYLLGNQAGRQAPPTATQYDWERERQARMPRVSPMANPGYPTQRRSFFSSDDRGEGSSNLGSMRRSTGFGGSNVR